MTTPYRYTPEQLALHAAWKKAAREGELEIPCASKSDATRLRFSLYNAVKPCREGRGGGAELEEAIRSVTVSLSDDPPMVRLQHKASTTMMQSLMAVLKDEQIAAPDAPELVMTAAEVESLNRLQKQVSAETEVPPRATPYYTRDA